MLLLSYAGSVALPGLLHEGGVTMRIEQIDIHHVAMPLLAPFRTAFGDSDTFESVLVRMVGDGEQGWGEAAPWSPPCYSSEYAAGVLNVVKAFLGPLVLGKDISSGDQLQQTLSSIKGNQFAKATLDLAWWDLFARTRGEPLWKTIGGEGPAVDVGNAFGVEESTDRLLDKIGGAVGAGFKRIKLKYRPGWEVDMVRAVREAFPDTVFHIDCNSAYTMKDLPMFKELDEYGLAFIEQPLAHDDLLDHAQLRREVRTPICLDESIISPDKAEKAVRIGACDWVNIKHGRCGGLTNSLAIHEICRKGGVGNWIGSMGETAVGNGFSIALATLGNVKYPADVMTSDRFYKEDLSEPPVVLSGPSQVSALEVPGIGFVPNAERLKEQALQQASLRA